jgi:hypothetical protein
VSAGPTNALDGLSERDRRTLAIRFLRSDEPMGSLLLRCKGHTPEAQAARLELACVLLMARQDAPDDLRLTDPALYKRLRERVTELRMGGWLESFGNASKDRQK